MEELKAKLIEEFDLITKQMNDNDNESRLSRWENLSHYRSGLQFGIDLINKQLSES